MLLSSLISCIFIILACIIGIYFLAVFIVSCKKILPILAIIAAVLTIINITKMRNAANEFEVLWLPVAFAVLTQLFYKGEAFMEIKLSTNVYNLVSVERKWNSWFAEDDDYILHYAPKETGGFFENAFFTAILYSFIFLAFDTYFVYVLPFYYLIMSCLDLLIMWGILPFTEFLYKAFRWLLVFVAIIASILILFKGIGLDENNKTDNNEDKYELYYVCNDLTNVNLNGNYEICYEYMQKKLFWYTPKWEPIYFMYDLSLNKGAQYIVNKKDKEYIKLFMENPEYDNKLVQYNIVDGSKYNYTFDRYVEKVDNPLKYGYFTELYPFEEDYSEDYIFMDSSFDYLDSYKFLYELTKEKYDKAEEIDYNKKKKTLTIVYNSKKDKDFEDEYLLHYEVIYKYKTDDEGLPIQLEKIECTVQLNKKRQERLTFVPIYGGTNLREVFNKANFDESTNIETSTMFDPENLFNRFNGMNGTIQNYDFHLSECEYGSYVHYIYDSNTKTNAIFYSHTTGQNAAKYNDLKTYIPNFYVHNPSYSLYTFEKKLISQDSSTFKWGTMGDEISSNAMTKCFDIFKDDCNNIEYEKYVYEYSAYIKITVYNNTLGTDVTYEFNFDSTEINKLFLEYVDIEFTYQNRIYEMTVWGNNHYDVLDPTK